MASLIVKIYPFPGEIQKLIWSFYYQEDKDLLRLVRFYENLREPLSEEYIEQPQIKGVWFEDENIPYRINLKSRPFYQS